MIILTLPYPVSANRYWQAVTVRGRQIMVPTKEAKDYKERVRWIAAGAGLRQPLSSRFEMWLRLYPDRPADWRKRSAADPWWDDSVRCIDLGNAEKVMADALQGIVYTDDRWVWRQHKERMAPDEHGARLIVAVRPMVRPAVAQREIAECASS